MKRILVPQACSALTTTKIDVFVNVSVVRLPSVCWNVLWGLQDLFVAMVSVGWVDLVLILVIPLLSVLPVDAMLMRTVRREGAV